MVFVAAGSLLWLWPFRSVPTGSRGVITQFGAIRGIQAEGFLLLPPWQSLNVFSTRAETVNIDGAEGSTLDTQPVHVNLTVRYAIDPNKVAFVFEQYSHDGDLSNYVTSGTQEVFKAVTAHYSAPDLIIKRQEVSQAIFKGLDTKLETYGARVLNVDMRNFAFQQSYMDAINKKVEQEQLKLVAQNRLLTVEAEQRQKVAIAEADANALKAKTDGESYQQRTLADAANYAKKKEAEAAAFQIRASQEALAASQGVLELKRIEVAMEQAHPWNGELPVQNIYGTTPVPYMQFMQPELREKQP